MNWQGPLSLLLLLGACSSASRSLPYSPLAPVPEARPSDVTTIHDSALATLKLPPLASVTLAEGYRELRLSTGHGMIYGAEYPLIRMVASPTTVQGQLLFYRGLMPSETPRSGNRWVARLAKPKADIKWAEILRRMDSLGLEALEVPRYDTGIMDAGELVVEFRRGSVYRSFRFNAPRYRTDPVSQRAAQVAAIIRSLAAPPQR